MADFTFAHREEGFDEHIEKSIRGYSNLLEDVISLSRYFVEDDTTVVDIGCSTGKLTKAMIDYNKDHSNNANWVGVEIADGFVDDLKKRKKELDSHDVEFIMEDILKGSVDNHIHCCPHINKRRTNIFDVVDQAEKSGMYAIRLMDNFSNSSGYASLIKKYQPNSAIKRIRGKKFKPR